MAKQKLTAVLGVDTKPFDKGLNTAQATAQGFGSKLGKIGSLLKGAMFAGGIAAAFTAAAKVINTTQLAGDKLAASIKGVGGAATAAAQSLASMDFSVSLRDAFKAAKELEQVYDDLADRQRSLNILSSANTLEVAKLQGLLRNRTVSEKERLEAAQKIKDIYAEEGRLREQAVSGAIQGEIDALKTKYDIDQASASAVLDYASNYAKFTTEQHDALNAAMEAEKKLGTYIANNSQTRDKVVASLRETASVTANEVVPELQKYIELWRPINDYTDEHRDQVSKLLIDYNNILNTRQRELNMADRLGDRLEQQAATVKEMVETISGKTTPAMSGASKGGLLSYFNIDPTKLSGTKGAEVSGDPFLERVNEQMREQQAIAQELTGVFSNMFSTMGQGWSAMADALIESIKRIAAEILAKAAVWAIMAIIFPGSAIASAGLGAFLGFDSLGSGGGASSVGGLASSGGSGSIQLSTKLSGNDILLSGSRSGSKLYRNT